MPPNPAFRNRPVLRRRPAGRPWLALGALLLGGCGHGSVAVQGRSSFEVLAPLQTASPPGADRDPSPTDLEVDPIPGSYAAKDCVLPVYPARALAAGAGARSLCVTVSFDETGTPTDVSPSWRGIPLQDRFSDDFFAAVKYAAMRWKITPPHLTYFRRQAGGRKTYLRTEALPDSEDIIFTFTACGTVKTGG